MLGRMTISQLLREHFARTGEEQAAFARRLELKPQTVSQLLAGDIKVPKAWIRRKLAAEFGLRHVDILVMAGELSADEIDPRLQPTYPADEVRVLSERWHQLTADERRMISYVLDTHLKLSGEEGVDNLVRTVDEPPAAFRRSATG